MEAKKLENWTGARAALDAVARTGSGASPRIWECLWWCARCVLLLKHWR